MNGAILETMVRKGAWKAAEFLCEVSGSSPRFSRDLGVEVDVIAVVSR